MKEPIFLFIESERGFYVGHEAAGFGGVEGSPEWERDPRKAKGFLKEQSDVDWNLKVIRDDFTCRTLKMWQTNMTENELVVYEVLKS